MGGRQNWLLKLQLAGSQGIQPRQSVSIFSAGDVVWKETDRLEMAKIMEM